MLLFFFSVHNFNSMAALGLQINETYISRQFILFTRRMKYFTLGKQKNVTNKW